MATETVDLGKVLITHKGDWTIGTDYDALDAVNNNGSSYLCILAAVSGILLTNATYWKPLSLSAYTYALGAGYTGSESDFENDLAVIGNKVGKSGNETITGVKTFSSSPIVPTPTTDTQAANLKTVTDIISQEVGTSIVKTPSENAVRISTGAESIATNRDNIYNENVIGTGSVISGVFNEKNICSGTSIIRIGVKTRTDNKLTYAKIVFLSDKNIANHGSIFSDEGEISSVDIVVVVQDGVYTTTVIHTPLIAVQEIYAQVSGDIYIELQSINIGNVLNILENTVLETNTVFERIVQTTIKTVKLTGEAGVDADFIGRRGIQNAIDSITDATDINRYIIKVYAGVYSATTVAQFDNAFEYGYSFIMMKPYIDIQGVSKDEVFILGLLPTNLGVNFQYSLYNVVVFHATAKIDGVTISGESLRYPVHIDEPTLLVDSTQTITNCRLIYEGKYGDAVQWTGWTALGCGTASGQKILIEDTEIKSPRVGIGFHSNTNFSKASEVIFRRCKILTTTTDATGSIVTSVSLGSMVKDRLIFDNCVLDSGYITISDTPWINTALEAQVADHAQMDLVFTGMLPRAVDGSELRGFGLKIKSKSVGSGSTVRIDKDSTAFPIIIGNIDDLITVKNRYGNQQVWGYQYKDGGDGLSGYAIGGHDIGMYLVGINTDYIGALGKRLGDCSSVNKTLTVIIDGTTYNIVFDKNYNGTTSTVLPNYTNTQIIAEIVAVIGAVATVEEYVVGRDYYPQFDGVLNMINADTVEVYNGMGVVFTDPKEFRKALNSDGKIDGICLDDGRVGDNCRIITDGEIFQWYSAQRFRAKQEEWGDLAFGDELGISSSNSGYFSTGATPKLLRCIGNGIVKII